MPQNPRNPNESAERIGKIPETQRIGRTNRRNSETQEIGRTNRRSGPNSAADLGGLQGNFGSMAFSVPITSLSPSCRGIPREPSRLLDSVQSKRPTAVGPRRRMADGGWTVKDSCWRMTDFEVDRMLTDGGGINLSVLALPSASCHVSVDKLHGLPVSLGRARRGCGDGDSRMIRAFPICYLVCWQPASPLYP